MVRASRMEISIYQVESRIKDDNDTPIIDIRVGHLVETEQEPPVVLRLSEMVLEIQRYLAASHD
jgi:hypothetical protein